MANIFLSRPIASGFCEGSAVENYSIVQTAGSPLKASPPLKQ
jgi:hypothetical protein